MKNWIASEMQMIHPALPGVRSTHRSSNSTLAGPCHSHPTDLEYTGVRESRSHPHREQRPSTPRRPLENMGREKWRMTEEIMAEDRNKWRACSREFKKRDVMGA